MALIKVTSEDLATVAVIGLVTTVAMAATHHPPASLRPGAGQTSAPEGTVSSGSPSAAARTTAGRSAASASTAADGGGGSVSNQAGSLPTVAAGGGTGHTSPAAAIQAAGGSSQGGPQPTVTATVTTTATATASLSAAEQQLADRLNASILDDCASAASELSVNTLAAINCYAITGPPSRPLIETLAPGHAETWFHNNTGGYTGSNCAAGGYLGNWSHDGTVEGQIGCGVTSSGLLRIVWTIDDNQVGLIAENSNYQGLDDWWKSNACALSNVC